MHVLYINLDRSTERNDKIQKSLQSLNISYTRVPGIDKNFLNKSCYQIKKNINSIPSKKVIAIILSHFKALQTMIDLNLDEVIIMEDDISLKYITNWITDINKINCNKNWKIIKLHTSLDLEIKKNIELYKKNILFTPINIKSLNSAGCYLIKKSTAIELLNKYMFDGIYKFPQNNEICVCEGLIFSVSDVYMYTLPLFCIINNNKTCSNNYNALDARSNAIIHKFWEGVNYDKDFSILK